MIALCANVECAQWISACQQEALSPFEIGNTIPCDICFCSYIWCFLEWRNERTLNDRDTQHVTNTVIRIALLPYKPCKRSTKFKF